MAEAEIVAEVAEGIVGRFWRWPWPGGGDRGPRGGGGGDRGNR